MVSRKVKLSGNPLIKTGKVFLFVAAIGLIFGLSYLLGNPILRDPRIGTHGIYNSSLIDWFDQFFPSIPKWYPKMGGGVSVTQGSPILAYLTIVVVHRVSDLSLLQAYRLVNFLTVPLMALNIYFLGWFLSRKQTTGFLSSLFYLLIPLSWSGLNDGARFTTNVATIFLPLVLLCFLGFLSHHVKRSQSGKRRLWLVGFILTLSLVILIDRLVSTAAILTLLLYAFGTLLLQSKNRPWINLSRAILGTLLAGMILLIVVAFFLVPLQSYISISEVGDTESLISEPISLPALPSFLGLAPFAEGDFPNLRIPAAVSVLLLVGVLLSIPDPREGRVVYFIIALTLALLFIRPLQTFISQSNGYLRVILAPRSWLQILVVFLPIGSAWGVYSFAWAIIHPKLSLGKEESRRLSQISSRRNLGGVLSSTLAFAMAACLVVWAPVHSVYGPQMRSSNEAGLLSQISHIEWPVFVINDDASTLEQNVGLVSELPLHDDLRVDVSPNLENLIGQLPALIESSQINMPSSYLSLIKPGWEYQRNVFYSYDPGKHELGNSLSLNNTANYFGISFAFIDRQQDPEEIYREAGWELIRQEDDIHLWRYPDLLSLATLTTRSAILITEKSGREIFMTVFGVANDGYLDFEEAILVEGQKRLDRYDLDDLKAFDAIFLASYDYRNRNKVWQTLASYAEQGGSLFIDTGWQYAVAEWEFQKTPPVFPVDRLVWTDYGTTSDYKLEAVEITGNIKVSDFRPLEWQGKPWALSGADPSDVREWGNVVLSASGRPLIVAGEYGRGRVVWSGMNLIGHARYSGENNQELLLLFKLMAWLTEGGEGEALSPPEVERVHPDQVIFSLDVPTGEDPWLYWREAYYPNWHAYLDDGSAQREIPIYRGGPGFMLMPIQTESKAVSITLQWERSFVEKTAGIVSIFGILLAAGMLLDGLFLGGNGFTWVKIAMTMWLPKPFLDEEVHTEKNNRSLQSVTDKTDGQPAPAPEAGGPAAPVEEIVVDERQKDEHANLLKSWMQSTDHAEDDWVNKILGRRNR